MYDIMPTPHFSLQLIPGPLTGPPSMFMLSLFNQNRLVPIVCSWLWEQPLEQGQPTSCQDSKENGSPSPAATNCSPLGVRPGEPLPIQAGIWAGLIL